MFFRSNIYIDLCKLIAFIELNKVMITTEKVNISLRCVSSLTRHVADFCIFMVSDCLLQFWWKADNLREKVTMIKK
jgi:hypothetical protein